MVPIAAVMIHVSDVEAALTWYGRAFPEARRRRLAGFDFEVLMVGDVHIEIVLADEKVGSGAAGSVVYWSVPDFERALDRFLTIGATLYRGPIGIQDGLIICQVRDPWGNSIGLRGPAGALQE